MWSDNETAIDLLGYHHLVYGVTSIVKNDGLSPATIGIFGDWGGGKSSLLRMVDETLRKEDDTLVVSFNGWLFEGYEDAKTALMGTILDEIEEQRPLAGKCKQLLKRLAARVNWFRVAGSATKHVAALAVLGPAGVGMTAGADLMGYVAEAKTKAGEAIKNVEPKDVQEFLKDDDAKIARKAIREFRDEFHELLKETKTKRLVVMIDDLDRCLPPVVIEILEAIKLFLSVDRTAFVIGADERLVKYAVRRRFPEMPGDAIQVANEYLEKLVQYPIRIPPLDSVEMETYINLLFAKNAGLSDADFASLREYVIDPDPAKFFNVRLNAGVAQDVLGKIPNELSRQLAMSQRIAPVLSTGLKGNPRQCKRFLNTLVLRQEMAASRHLELEQRILAKLMLLEYLYPVWFRRISALQATAGGRPPEIAELERQANGGGDKLPEKAALKKLAKSKGAKEKEDEIVEVEPQAKIVKTDLPDDLQGWLHDGWMRAWIVSQPQLSETDLSPYFYFSRDRLDTIAASASRMTPAAQQILQKMIHESEAQRNLGLKEAANMGQADAAAVFEALVERVDLNEKSDGTALTILLNFCEVRNEHLAEMVSVLQRLPLNDIPLGITSSMLRVTKDTPVSKQAFQLLESWSDQDEIPRLKQSASNALKRR